MENKIEEGTPETAEEKKRKLYQMNVCLSVNLKLKSRMIIFQRRPKLSLNQWLKPTNARQINACRKEGKLSPRIFNFRFNDIPPAEMVR